MKRSTFVVFAQALMLVAASLPLTLPAQAQEPVIPYAAPRPATTLVMLPDGSTVHVELATTDQQREYGLMERTKLPEGRGMLFVHDDIAHHAYWMYHCKIGLDIIWMDENHRIAEMSPNTPPCTGKAKTCPNYGGQQPSKYVLELPVGSITKHSLAVGQTIAFRLE
jgi:uncharacterized membrane protein (UPF0127 family)